jgi:hypothetical protein
VRFGPVTFLACLLSVAACASVTPAARHVERIREKSQLQRCDFVGDVSVRPSPWADADDLVRLRNRAAEIGADAIFLDSMFVPPGGRLHAGAYACHVVVPRPRS